MTLCVCAFLRCTSPRRLGLRPIADEDKLLRQEDVNSRIIWRMHMVSIWLLVLTLMAYFKVR